MPVPLAPYPSPPVPFTPPNGKVFFTPNYPLQTCRKFFFMSSMFLGSMEMLTIRELDKSVSFTKACLWYATWIWTRTCNSWLRACSNSFHFITFLMFLWSKNKLLKWTVEVYLLTWMMKGTFWSRFRLLGSCKFVHWSVFCPAIFRGPKPACLHRLPESSHASSWCDVRLLCSMQHRHRRAGSGYAPEPNLLFGLKNLQGKWHLDIDLHLCRNSVTLSILSALFIRL
jgi:hypothetical protein